MGHMSTDDVVFFLIGGVFFGFVALRPNAVIWLISYGKPNLVPHGVAKLFRVMACVVLLLMGGNVIFNLVQGHH
jgi:hypothetical protein